MSSTHCAGLAESGKNKTKPQVYFHSEPFSRSGSARSDPEQERVGGAGRRERLGGGGSGWGLEEAGRPG